MLQSSLLAARRAGLVAKQLRLGDRAQFGAVATRAFAVPRLPVAARPLWCGRLSHAKVSSEVLRWRSFASQAEPPEPSPPGSPSGVSSSSSGRSSGSTANPNSPYTPPPDPKEWDMGELKQGADRVQFTWRSAIFTCVVCAASLWYLDYLLKRREANNRAITSHERIGKPKLGGPFELVDRKGQLKTDKDFLGQYVLLYFGFTFCPDVCPQEMEKQTRVIELLDEALGPVVTPMFISIDPQRDTPAAVNEYCEEWHKRLVGLTGTPEQVKKVSRAYRVYYNTGIKTSESDYLIDHSIIHYFVGKKGEFIDFFGKNMTAQEMADKMRGYILQDEERKAARKLRRGVESADEDQ